MVGETPPILECPRCRRLVDPRSINFTVAAGYPVTFGCGFCSVGLSIPKRAWWWATGAAYVGVLLVMLPIIWLSHGAIWGIFAAWVPAMFAQDLVGRSVAKRLTDHLVALSD
jgi:hypothetical protein